MWDTIRELVADGCTVLLTTQYLDEADQLADRIAVIDRGRKVAEGTPDELKTQVGSSTLQLRLPDPAQTAGPPPTWSAGCSARSRCSRPRRAASTSPSPTPNRAADVLIAPARARAARSPRSPSQKPTLDEVFLALTGHDAERPTPTRPEMEPAR